MGGSRLVGIPFHSLPQNTNTCSLQGKVLKMQIVIDSSPIILHVHHATYSSSYVLLAKIRYVAVSSSSQLGPPNF